MPERDAEAPLLSQVAREAVWERAMRWREAM